MEIRNVSKYLAVAVLAGIWGCSPKQTAQRSYVYDDLYSASSDVRAVAYSNKQNNVVGEQAREANSAGNDYYNKTEAEKYSGTVKQYSSSVYDNAYDNTSQYAYNNGYGNWNPYGWNSWNSWNNWYYPMYGFSPGWSIGLGFGSGFYRPWGLSSWYGGGFYDPWYSSWGYNPYYYNSWGYYPSYYGGGYYGGYYRDPYYYGGGNVVVKPGNSNTGGSYSRPRTTNYGRSQSAYNNDFATRSNPNPGASVSPNRGGRTSAYNDPSASNSYYSRPRRDGGDYSSFSGNSGTTYRNNGTVNRDNNSYSRGWNNDNGSRNNSWSQPSNNSWNNNSPSRSYSAPSSGGGGGGGGGGARSRGPR